MTSATDSWPFPVLGPPRPMTGTANCSTVTAENPDRPCPAPVAWHIAWSTTGGVSTSFACDQHMDYITAHSVYEDRHRIGAACSLPGMTWWGPRGMCHLDAGDDEERP